MAMGMNIRRPIELKQQDKEFCRTFQHIRERETTASPPPHRRWRSSAEVVFQFPNITISSCPLLQEKWLLPLGGMSGFFRLLFESGKNYLIYQSSMPEQLVKWN
ncbi:hypothetical protein CMV_009200 [Castanea mollissima]|uniref:Uncharacterized protein n=1 Tax=Castanea mollissima TaxID=60419 RepID=A0A8J4R7H9_9ROSI|nr:hypothetical protein CMV_009200 [Castanea mollissima]